MKLAAYFISKVIATQFVRFKLSWERVNRLNEDYWACNWGCPDEDRVWQE